MDNNWFKRPGDLEETKTSISGTSYLQSAGDLPTNEPSNSIVIVCHHILKQLETLTLQQKIILLSLNKRKKC